MTINSTTDKTLSDGEISIVKKKTQELNSLKIVLSNYGYCIDVWICGWISVAYTGEDGIKTELLHDKRTKENPNLLDNAKVVEALKNFNSNHASQLIAEIKQFEAEVAEYSNNRA